MLVCIEGRIYLKMLLEYSRRLIIEAIGYSRVSLEQHSLSQSVEIYTGDRWHLRLIVGLSVDDRGEYGHFDHGKALQTGFLFVGISPEGVIGSLLTGQDLLHGLCPVDLVCIRDEQGKDVLTVESEGGDQRRVPEGIDYVGGVQHHLVADLPGKTALQPHGS